MRTDKQLSDQLKIAENLLDEIRVITSYSKKGIKTIPSKVRQYFNNKDNK